MVAAGLLLIGIGTGWWLFGGGDAGYRGTQFGAALGAVGLILSLIGTFTGTETKTQKQILKGSSIGGGVRQSARSEQHDSVQEVENTLIRGDLNQDFVDPIAPETPPEAPGAR